jgi:lysophospholipase L1-like esterase
MTASATRVFVAGDSTAALYDLPRYPQTGWGQALGAFAAPGVAVVDRAVPGRSTKSFMDEGALEAIRRDIGPGDWLLISFGHNDQKIEDPRRYTDPRTTYVDNLRRYLDVATVNGATPVLVTSVERRRFRGGRAHESLGEYPAAMLDLARQEGVDAVDLHALSMALWDAMGEEATKACFMWIEPGHPNYPEGLQDDTHFRPEGAVAVARLVATALTEQGIAPGLWTGLDRDVAEDELVWVERQDW